MFYRLTKKSYQYNIFSQPLDLLLSQFGALKRCKTSRQCYVAIPMKITYSVTNIPLKYLKRSNVNQDWDLWFFGRKFESTQSILLCSNINVSILLSNRKTIKGLAIH